MLHYALVFFIIALIVFGPRKLPEIGKSLGKMIAEFRRASNDLKRTIEDEVEADRQRELNPASATTSPLPVTAPSHPEAAPYDAAETGAPLDNTKPESAETTD